MVVTFGACTFLAMACQAIVAVLMFIKYKEYSSAVEHQYFDLQVNKAYDAFTGSILADFARNENDKWRRYQESSTPPCCGYDVASFIDGTAWELNMMNAPSCFKPFSSFEEVGAPNPSGSNATNATSDDDFMTKKRSVIDMLEITLAISDSMKLGTDLQKACVPVSSKIAPSNGIVR